MLQSPYKYYGQIPEILRIKQVVLKKPLSFNNSDTYHIKEIYV